MAFTPLRVSRPTSAPPLQGWLSRLSPPDAQAGIGQPIPMSTAAGDLPLTSRVCRPHPSSPGAGGAASLIALP